MARSRSFVPAAAVLAACGYASLKQLQAFVAPSVSTPGRNLRSRVSMSAGDMEQRLKEWEMKYMSGQVSSAPAPAYTPPPPAPAPAPMPVPVPVAAAPAPAPVPVAPAPAPVPIAPPVVSSGATQADVDAAFQDLKLKKWAAEQMAGSPQGAAAAARAQQAEASYNALKAQVSGQPAPAVAAPARVAAAPAPAVAAAAPVAAAASGASKEALAQAKQSAQLLTWAANKLSAEGSAEAAAMQAKAAQAVKAFEALKQGAGAPAAAAAPAVAAAPTPVAAAPAVPVSGMPSKAEVEKAKKEMELHEWAAKQLVDKQSLQASVMQQKAAASRQTYEALKAMLETAR